MFSVHINKTSHQSSSSECGMYSLYFLIREIEDNPIGDDEMISDKIVEDMRSVYFRPHVCSLKSTTSETTPCSPNYKGDKICFTKDVLGDMIERWNSQSDESERIVYDRTMSKYGLWKQLRSKLNRQPWCLIDDPMFHDMNLEEFFGPPQPYKNGLNTWLSETDINKVMRQYEKAYPGFLFLGTTPIDFEVIGNAVANFDLSTKNIVNGTIKRIGIVFNTDPHDRGGTHWFSMFIDVPTKTIKVFDSTGNEPPNEIHDLIEKLQNQTRKKQKK